MQGGNKSETEVGSALPQEGSGMVVGEVSLAPTVLPSGKQTMLYLCDQLEATDAFRSFKMGCAFYVDSQFKHSLSENEAVLDQ